VGGNGLPSTAVTSVLVLPPFGPTIPYCPEVGVFCPGFKGVCFFAIVHFTSFPPKIMKTGIVIIFPTFSKFGRDYQALVVFSGHHLL
jgi:hypothetical protein